MMRVARLATLVLCTTLAFADEPAAKTPAETAYAAGQAALVKADFDSALKSFIQAAKLDPNAPEFTREAVLLRRIVDLRGQLGRIKDDARWQKAAESLYAYYSDRGCTPAATEMAAALNKRVPSAASANRYARTLLDTGEAQQARAVLEAIPDDQADLHSRVLHALALTRLDEREAAEKALQRIAIPMEVTRELNYDAARLNATLGHWDSAERLLRKFFQATPPSRLVAARAQTKACVDFASVAETEGFHNVLRTASKCSESSCSSGGSCGQCPSRSSCSGAQKEAE